MFVAKPQALAQADGVQRQVKSICRSAHAILIERQVEGLHSALRLVPIYLMGYFQQMPALCYVLHGTLTRNSKWYVLTLRVK